MPRGQCENVHEFYLHRQGGGKDKCNPTSNCVNTNLKYHFPHSTLFWTLIYFQDSWNINFCVVSCWLLKANMQLKANIWANWDYIKVKSALLQQLLTFADIEWLRASPALHCHLLDEVTSQSRYIRSSNNVALLNCSSYKIHNEM